MSNDTFNLEPSFTAFEMAKQEKEAGKGQEQEAAQKGFASPPQESQAPPAAKKDNKRNFEPLPAGYYYKDNFIYRTKTEEDKNSSPDEIFVCNGIYFLGLARDNDSLNWSYACEIQTPDLTKHRLFIKCQIIYKKNQELIELLASYGIDLNEKETTLLFKKIKPLFKKYSRIIDKNGWHNESYIFSSGKVISLTNKEFIFNSNTPSNLYNQAGSLEAWQEVKRLIQGNTRLEFAYLTAFAGVLLDPANFESFGFAFEGASSSGKTTALQVASAVWGGKDHIKQWRATANGIESVAELFNDNILILDELGQVSSKDLDNIIYMLANGQGKSRANKNGDSRQAKKWRLVFLSSGEIGIAQKLAEDGKKPRAGQEVRFIAIPTDKEHISNLHGLQTAKDLVDKVKQLTAENYGFDGVKFIEFVVTHYERIKAKINGKLQSLSKEFYQGNNTQISRVATYFALIEYTRLVLIGAGLIPNDFAVGTVKACFNDWIVGRDKTDSHEEKEILETVKSFIDRYPNKFQNVKGTDTYINDRAGYKDLDTSPPVYYFSNTFFTNELLKGYNLNFACKVLERYGWIKKENDRYTVKKTFEKSERKSYYPISIEEKD